MARPREFDEETAVAKAVTVFWRLGYSATSVRDLGDALELSPSSLYRAFGDKHALYLRALDYYREHESTEGCRRFQAARPTVDELVQSVTTLALGNEAGTGSPTGCFVINAAAELGDTDPGVSARTEAAFDLTRTGLRDLLARLRGHGQIPVRSDPDELTDLLFTLILGWRLRMRAGHHPDQLVDSIRQAVTTLVGRHPAAAKDPR